VAAAIGGCPLSGTVELRFAFGKNWSRFLDAVDDARVATAEKSLRDMLGVRDLGGRRFLDAGCGSGLFSLAARRLGAEVHSFDLDPASVACAEALRAKYFPKHAGWTVEKGSVLDEGYLIGLGTFDVVYSWGVLHHTGSLWTAVESVQRLVAPGGKLFIALYNDQGRASRRWHALKKAYNALPPGPRHALLLLAFARIWGLTLLRDLLSGRPGRTWKKYSKDRGMSPWRDVVDWVGGYPFEVASPEAVFRFLRDRGFRLTEMTTVGGGYGCNEFVFEREDP